MQTVKGLMKALDTKIEEDDFFWHLLWPISKAGERKDNHCADLLIVRKLFSWPEVEASPQTCWSSLNCSRDFSKSNFAVLSCPGRCRSLQFSFQGLDNNVVNSHSGMLWWPAALFTYLHRSLNTTLWIFLALWILGLKILSVIIICANVFPPWPAASTWLSDVRAALMVCALATLWEAQWQYALSVTFRHFYWVRCEWADSISNTRTIAWLFSETRWEVGLMCTQKCYTFYFILFYFFF